MHGVQGSGPLGLEPEAHEETRGLGLDLRQALQCGTSQLNKITKKRGSDSKVCSGCCQS